MAGALSLAAASALAGQFTLYERAAFQGQSATTTIALPDLFAPGRYDTLGALDGRVIKSAYLVVAVQERVATVVAVPPGRAVVYQYANFGGPSAVIEYGRAPDMDWTSFRNPASSLRIESGSWLVCSDIGYQGECRVLDPGDYPVLPGLGNGIASARQVWRPQYGSLDLRNQATR